MVSGRGSALGGCPFLWALRLLRVLSRRRWSPECAVSYASFFFRKAFSRFSCRISSCSSSSRLPELPADSSSLAGRSREEERLFREGAGGEEMRMVNWEGEAVRLESNEAELCIDQ
jgi:hypothetical protein